MRLVARCRGFYHTRALLRCLRLRLPGCWFWLPVGLYVGLRTHAFAVLVPACGYCALPTLLRGSRTRLARAHGCRTWVMPTLWLPVTVLHLSTIHHVLPSFGCRFARGCTVRFLYLLYHSGYLDLNLHRRSINNWIVCVGSRGSLRFAVYFTLHAVAYAQHTPAYTGWLHTHRGFVYASCHTTFTAVGCYPHTLRCGCLVGYVTFAHFTLPTLRLYTAFCPAYCYLVRL